MTDSNDLGENTGAAEAAPTGIGPQLRAARESKGLTTEQVAAETRISRRHIENLEAGRYTDLPGRTYAIGFSRTIAKVVGLDQDDVVTMVSAELDAQQPSDSRHRAATFEPGDPARAPSRGLVWFSIFAVIVLLAGIFFAARLMFSPAAELPSLVEQEQAEQKAAQAAAAAQAAEEEEPIPSSGPVVFTAQGDAWVRFTDAQGRVLQETTLTEGDTYTVPQDAEGPQLITGRPDLLAITIGGREVPKISEELETVTDIPVSAEALLARGQPAAPTTAPAATPAPTATATPAG